MCGKCASHENSPGLHQDRGRSASSASRKRLWGRPGPGSSHRTPSSAPTQSPPYGGGGYYRFHRRRGRKRKGGDWKMQGRASEISDGQDERNCWAAVILLFPSPPSRPPGFVNERRSFSRLRYKERASGVNRSTSCEATLLDRKLVH